MHTPTVNRYLKDKAMDRIDHALGRPVDPMGKTYRDHYATDSAERIAELTASPYWKPGGQAGGMQFFYVTQAGREALAVHLREIGDPHRAYSVRFEGDEWTLAGKSRGKARYRAYLDISDRYPDMTFGEFCRRASVRLDAAHD